MGGRERRPRAIGPWGTSARLVVGLAVLWLALTGGASARWEIRWWEIVLGLVAFPAGLATAQLLRAQREPRPLRATGGLADCVNCVALAILLIVPWTSAATIVFVGSGTLVAAWRG